MISNEIQKKWLKALEQGLHNSLPETDHSGLYEPLRYFYSLGGKRMRPMLAYIGASLFTEKWQKATPAALAVEIFHNFTLVHDDIMDKAPLRRGKETVHEKWDTATAILAGDRMMISAYEMLSEAKRPLRKKLHEILNKAAAEICEGQMEDMRLETDDDPTMPAYIEMIRKKTAVLLGAALQMGAISGGAKDEEAESLYKYGVKVGLGFQIMDDYLDVFGKTEFGKVKAGDILAAKRSFIVCRSMSEMEDAEKKRFIALLNNRELEPEAKIEKVITVFKDRCADAAAKDVAKFYFEEADALLKAIELSDENREMLQAYVEEIKARQV